MSEFRFPIRVYYEDTDAGGVVYYANYLKFAERARTEWLRHLGIEQTTLRTLHGVLFVVRRCAVEYLRPGRLDDLLTVESRVSETGRTRFTVVQRILRGEEELVTLSVGIACIDESFRPARLPDAVAVAFAA